MKPFKNVRTHLLGLCLLAARDSSPSYSENHTGRRGYYTRNGDWFFRKTLHAKNVLCVCGATLLCTWLTKSTADGRRAHATQITSPSRTWQTEWNWYTWSSPEPNICGASCGEFQQTDRINFTRLDRTAIDCRTVSAVTRVSWDGFVVLDGCCSQWIAYFHCV